MARRRYDTNALVDDLKRERRNAMVLTLAGLVILVVLVYSFIRLRSPSVPEVPKPGDPAAAVAAPVPRPPPEPTPAPAVVAEAPKPVEPATLTIRLPRAGPVFVDGALVAKKVKEHEVTLEPGKHQVATRAGRKRLELQLEAEAGKHYRVELDPRRKKKPVVETLP